MKTIAVLNQKGGVGKTAITYNLAAVKAEEGHRVLMIDLDPQCSLTISAGIEPGEDRLEGQSSVNLFEKKDPADACFEVKSTGMENLFVVPSDIDLAETEARLIIQKNSERKLRKAVLKLSEYFDYCFIDCPPNLGQLTFNALVAADAVIVPCKTDYLSYRGLRALMDTIDQVKDPDDDMNPQLEVIGIVGTFYESRVKDQQAVLGLMEQWAPVIGIVRKSADVVRGHLQGLPVVLAVPKSAVAEELRQIAKKI